MSIPHVDTDVIIRLVTGDDPAKRQAATRLFQRVENGELELAIPDIAIADAVYVLASRRLYGLPREDVAMALTTILRLSGIHVRNKRTMLEALDLYRSTNLDFGDCYIVASMRQSDTRIVYAYDRDFDRFPDVQRREPE